MTKFYTLLMLITLLLGSFNNVSAQTNVAGGNVSGTWTLAGSPYLINGSIQIPNGQTLTIEPGVTVDFQGHYKLYVQGQILAIGTVSDTITFTASDTTTGWKGIRFENTPNTNDSSKFFYCKVQYGNATGTSPNNNGGGLYFYYFSKAIISNSRIIYCSANDNGYGYGGGIYCNQSNPTIINNYITNNNSYNQGAGIYCYYSDPIISSNIISYNTNVSTGGGICCTSSSPIITNNVISYNSAIAGGGIYSWLPSYPIISNNTISNNYASFYGNSNVGGGGICCSTNSIPLISKNLISNNTSNKYGGGILVYNCNPTITNNIISNNTAINFAGGGVSCSNSNPSIANNTISNNLALNGGGIYFEFSSPTLNNCLVWGNTATTSGSQVYLFTEDSDPNIYYSNIQGGDAAFGTNDVFYTGTYQNNLDSDPLFVAPTAGSGTAYDGTSADWSLQAGSPCINAGTTDTTGLNLPSTDIAGNPRVSNGRIDIGAYEHLGTSINNPITNNIINIYPNPNNGKFLLYLENYESKNYTLEIYDITGQIIYSDNYENKTFLAENIVLSQFESGVYFVKVIAGNSNYSKNMVIIK